MSSTNTTTTQTTTSPRSLLDIANTTPQQQQTNADIDYNKSGESFIDTDMGNNIDNEDTNQHQQQADSDYNNRNMSHETNILDRTASSSMSNDDPNGIWDDSIDEIEGVEEEEEKYSSPQQVEMAPLIEEEDLDEIPIADESEDEMISTPVEQPPPTNNRLFSWSTRCKKCTCT